MCETNENYAKIETLLRFARVVAFDTVTLVYFVPSLSLKNLWEKRRKKKNAKSVSLHTPLTTYGKVYGTKALMTRTHVIALNSSSFLFCR